jgi:hypothetical protein
MTIAIKHEATPLIIDIAKGFITLVRGIEPNWRKAYLRFGSHHSVSEAKGSYVHQSGVEIIDVLMHKDFFHGVARKGQGILAALGKTEGVFLLVTDSNFDYETKFEYHDMNRWRISKLGGGTGIPEGIE